MLVGNPAFSALSIAATLMVMIYAFGNVSGGRFNPAVTLGVLLSKPEFGMFDTACYMAAQLVGAVLGSLGYMFLFGKVFQVRDAFQIITILAAKNKRIVI